MNQPSVETDSPQTQMPQLLITPPLQCLSCGDKKNPETPGWFGINLQALGAPGVFLFACLKCNAVYVNIEAQENSEIMNAFRDRVMAEKEEEEKKGKIILSG